MELLIKAIDNFSGDTQSNAYKIREAPGDVVEVEEQDGFYWTPENPTGRGWNKNVFYLILCPGVTKDEVPVYNLPIIDGYKNDKPIVARLRQNSVNLGQISFDENNIATLNRGQMIAAVASNMVRN